MCLGYDCCNHDRKNNPQKTSSLCIMWLTRELSEFDDNEII